jgi:two-component system sensor histidine kinase/response regulator
VLVNLVGNGIKFTPSGEICLAVHVAGRTSDEVVLHFAVTDTGIGISPDDQERIFAPFTQVDTSTTRRYGGTGLGLAIASELIRMQGGQLSLRSEQGQGSTFYFESRFGLADPIDLRGREGRLASELRGLPVLVVDNNATHCRFLENTLGKWGMQPRCVSSGSEALEALKHGRSTSTPFRLVLLDARLPGVDGGTLADQVRSDRWAPAIILMLPSANRQTLQERAERLHVGALLNYPITPSNLLDAILRAMQLDVAAMGNAGQLASFGRRRAPLRVLLAEDTPANRNVVRSILQKRGHLVRVAADGRQAIEAVERETFDVVLMDVQMPEMDGLQATG